MFRIDCLGCINLLMRFFSRIGNIKKTKLFSSSLTQHSTLIRLLPPSFFLMYNLSTSLIGCNFPYIVTFSLDFLSTFFNSLPFHCSIPVPYLNRTTVYVFIAVVLFFPLSFHFRINRSLRFIYSFIVFFFFFISSSLILSNSSILKYVYP